MYMLSSKLMDYINKVDDEEAFDYDLGHEVKCKIPYKMNRFNVLLTQLYYCASRGTK